ncbi:hypothetical protein M3J07_002505 [Ascochyta lentis]
MVPNIPDHYLWLGLGILTYTLTHHVSSNLLTITHLTTIHHPTSPPHSPPAHHPQSSTISPSSLLTLATSPNTEISTSATKILCERFYAHEAARRALLRDLGSGDVRVARRARRAVGVLRGVGVFGFRVEEVGGRGGGGAGGAFAGFGRGHVWDDVDGRGDGDVDGDVDVDDDDVEGWDTTALRERGVGAVGSERDVRRRRREAVVIHEGEGRVGEGDVWMRDREGVMSLEVDELVIDGVAY